MTTPQQVARQILAIMAEEVLSQAKRNLLAMSTDSRRAQALREDLRVQIIDVGEGVSEAAILTDYYWAIYYHDGRGPINARPGRFLVFFRNPDDDPRIGGARRDYPRRASDIRPLQLSRGRFTQLLREGRMVATKRVGPAEPHPFLEVGFSTLNRIYGPKVEEAFSAFVRDFLGPDLLDGEEFIEFEL